MADLTGCPDVTSRLRLSVKVLSSIELRITTDFESVNAMNTRIFGPDVSHSPKSVIEEGGGDHRILLSYPLPPGRYQIEIGEEVTSPYFDIRGERNTDCVRRSRNYSAPLSEPDLDYLSKDYGSFRRLMLDRINQLVPGWKERNPADLGVTLVESLAYHADRLSYYQDAVATEAYLETARLRISVGRHARLLDYRMHEGCSARCLVQFWMKPSKDLTIDTSAKLTTYLRPERAIEESYLDDPEAGAEEPVVFETLGSMQLYSDQNYLYIYPVDGKGRCLKKGTFRTLIKNGGTSLTPGTFLILASIRGWKQRFCQQIDAVQLHPVRLTRIYQADDSSEGRILEWAEEDALPFPMESSPYPEGDTIPLPTDPEEVTTVAFGNIVPADHGLSVQDEDLDQVADLGSGGIPSAIRTPHLKGKRLAYAVRYDPLEQAAVFFSIDPKDAMPQVYGISIINGIQTEDWEVVANPLASDMAGRTFTVEMGDDGTAFIRADGIRNHLKNSGKATVKRYRIGGGPGGNIGVGSLYHVLAKNDVGLFEDAIEGITNPMPAKGGAAPEGIERVKLLAPHAFKDQKRAVTLADYERMAMRTGMIQRSKAIYCPTGSWSTIVVAIDPFEPNLLEESIAQVRSAMETVRMAGQDIEVVGPVHVPIIIEIVVTVKRGFLFENIEYELNNIFSGAEWSDGRKGMFHPANLTFDQSVPLSDIYKEAGKVDGVDTVQVTKFRRMDDLTVNPALPERIEVKEREIIYLDNDPDNADNGVFKVNLGGWA